MKARGPRVDVVQRNNLEPDGPGPIWMNFDVKRQNSWRLHAVQPSYGSQPQYASGGGQPQYANGGGGQPQYASGGGQAQYGAASDENIEMLEKAVPGVPGEDYPIYSEVPDTSFSCDGQVDGGYYADPEAECQVFHICTADGAGGLTQYSFLCPNGTVFSQQYFICDWWFNFDCSEGDFFRNFL